MGSVCLGRDRRKDDTGGWVVAVPRALAVPGVAQLA